MKKIYCYHTKFSGSMRSMVKFIICLLMTSAVHSQTVNDVLEKGNYVKKESDIYFKLDTILEFGVLNKKDQGKRAIDYEFKSDSVLFLTSDHNTDVFIKPLNPLRFTVSSSAKMVPDAISKAESDALKAIRELLITANNGGSAGGAAVFVTKKDKEWEKIHTQMKHLEKSLIPDNDAIKKMGNTFKALKKLKFADQVSTRNQFDAAVKDMETIKEHLENLDPNIKLIEEYAKNFEKGSKKQDSVLLRYVYQDYARYLREAYNARNKQYANLEKAKSLVEKAIENAEANNWQIKLRPISVTKTENAIYTITIDTNAWNLDENGSLVQKSEGKKFSRAIIIRKFQLLVPEVSVGTYYTFFKYKVYGTTTDSTGQQFVGEPTFNVLKRFNASVMLNYNFYIPNTPVRPLLQFGGGIQSGIPVLLAGGGLRIGNSNAFSITGGVALTWMRELQTLKVGDRVSGTAELEKDLKYEFSFPLKGYIGIQYNF